jgi:hypothetical protein
VFAGGFQERVVSEFSGRMLVNIKYCWRVFIGSLLPSWGQFTRHQFRLYYGTDFLEHAMKAERKSIRRYHFGV